ncbi:C-GCAxxG-C-C family protein [Natroniella sulfidigena]|uniref:C-GCAxxG-C-C family (seleno)protein n=1 Tax=Natroniella sulfidigena TaxID=723921 RepID=UPI00200B6684|nr:C-GCAxxG-C-C family (seleno)protein [Natroniella sulfidigena]MCK8817861.1 C-GCAxxG-C-C family protein [Natroniella sulfidigena]
MNTNVNKEQVREDAEELFNSGQFYCSEAIISSIKDHFELDISDRIIAMASGFPVGIGKSKCVCGAVSGGVMAISYFFGRTTGGDPRVEHNLRLVHELQQSFKNNHNYLCCKVLTKGFDMASGEHKEQCASFTGEIAAKATEIIIRELKAGNATVEGEK